MTRQLNVTEQDFLRALAEELSPLERQPFEFTLSEIMQAISQHMGAGKLTPTRDAVRMRLDFLVDKGIMTSRRGLFETGRRGQTLGRREQWAYTVINPDKKKVRELIQSLAVPKVKKEKTP